MIAGLLTTATLALVVALLWALRTGSRRHRQLKAAAATGFVAVAVAAGATGSGFGRAVLVALVLSWVGDLLLSYTSRRALLAGLAAFLSAHLAYIVAFSIRGTDAPHPALTAGVLAAATIAAWWILPHADRRMRGPVTAYVAAISAMVVLAAATAEFEADPRIPLGAALFYVSDLAVARDRFVASGFINRAVGLPLYFGGQILLAWAAGG